MHSREKLPFLEVFMTKYAPKNLIDMKDTSVRRGKYRGYVFVVTETRATYFVEMLDKKRSFSSAYLAGKWVEKNADEQARRDRPSKPCEMVQPPVSGVQMPPNASEFW